MFALQYEFHVEKGQGRTTWSISCFRKKKKNEQVRPTTIQTKKGKPKRKGKRKLIKKGLVERRGEGKEKEGIA